MITEGNLDKLLWTLNERPDRFHQINICFGDSIYTGAIL